MSANVYASQMGRAASGVADVLAARRRTMRLVEPLTIEDWGAQSMPDASPTKWHLAHTTWFFERFVLRPLGVAPVSESYDYLFNSYYESVGARQPRHQRGLLTRPGAEEIVAYRRAVDARLADLDGSPRLAEVATALELGRHHEEQHQELILTDIKHLFGQSALAPAYLDAATPAPRPLAQPLRWELEEGGLSAIGHDNEGFSFDNERPRHKVYVEPFAIGSRLVTCGEYLEFIADGGYLKPELWLSEGWVWIHATSTRAPMYWDLDRRDVFTLRGRRAIDPLEPVCHVSYYEADAYARWAGARLPTEAEWEIMADRTVGAARAQGRTPGRTREGEDAPLGALLEDGPESGPNAPNTQNALHPRPANGARIAQVLGDTWEWTQSAYSPYPGFSPMPGAFGEYNGKFMVSQLVLRGGSCATPKDHIRTTYRNFFPPSAQWQFSGIRLARDV